MSIEQIIFLILTAVVLGGAFGVVSSRNILHSALFLVLSFAGVAGYYVLLQAGFLAAVQVLVYIGAIAVLILFTIMLSRRVMAAGQTQSNSQWWISAVIAIVLGFLLLVIIGQINFPIHPAEVPENSTAQIGQLFLGGYVLPFELASILLLAALVGAVILARDVE